MYSFLPLLLAHFLSDFPFQTKRVVGYKQKSFWGVALHGLTHGVASAALLFPFWNEPKIWVGIMIIVVTHALIDHSKLRVGRSGKINPLSLYVLDQAAHLGIIGLVSAMVGPLSAPPAAAGYYTDPSVYLYLLTLTLSTYFFDVTRWTYFNSKKPRPYERDYALIARNATIVTLAFAVYWATR